MNDERLTEKLAVQVMGWKVAPGRFLKSGRAWTPSWRFSPLTNLEQAFNLLDHAANGYTLATDKNGIFEADVRVGARVGKASGEPKARTISLALADALGLEIPDETRASISTPARRRPSPRSKIDGI
jgi:hypothetical protein